MLVWGTVNPEGEHDSHAGVLLRQKDIDDIASHGSLLGKPVKLEHKGAEIGQVKSVWKHNNRLDCVLQIHDNVEGLFAQDFIQSGRCKELSLGYIIDMKHSKGEITGGKKQVVEVSIVKKGARHECEIRGFAK
jgi:hypothetical protein